MPLNHAYIVFVKYDNGYSFVTPQEKPMVSSDAFQALGGYIKIINEMHPEKCDGAITSYSVERFIPFFQ